MRLNSCLVRFRRFRFNRSSQLSLSEQSASERLGVLSGVDRGEPSTEPSDVWLEGGLDDALSDLAPDVRQAIELRVVHDLSYAELAETVGTTPGAARVRVHRGLSALRNRLLKTKEATR